MVHLSALVMKILLLINLSLFVVLSFARADRPNVLFVLVDDMGWRDLGVEGSSFYETPNIDALARSGVRFLNGYAACQVCSPSRASIMIGQYPARVGITDWIGAKEGDDWKRNTKLQPALYKWELPKEPVTMAEAFQEFGYATFFAGKWHLGDTEEDWPEYHGFEINKGGHSKGSPPGGYFSPYSNPRLESGPLGEYLPFRLANETQTFIRNNVDSGKPFFAFLSFYNVHGPAQTTKDLWRKYRAKAAAQPKPETRFLIDRTSPVRQVQDDPIYGGMVEAVDQSVGQVLGVLDELGLRENTIVVFTSDNGGVSAGDHKATSNLPLRGGKGRQWEGGIRVPYYISWPASVSAGIEVEEPASGIDFLPTLMELAGVDVELTQELDGVSLAPLMHGKAFEERTLFWHYPHYGNQGGEPSSIMRQGDWKLIHYYEDGRNELYNLSNDPMEQFDLATRFSDLASTMKAQLDDWLQTVDARYPYPNKNYSAKQARKDRKQLRSKGLPRIESEAAAKLDPDWVPKDGWWEETGK